jgi:hypothetical protein
MSQKLMKFESLKFWCKILNSEKAKARNYEIEQNGMKLLFTIIQYHEIPLGTIYTLPTKY